MSKNFNFSLKDTSKIILSLFVLTLYFIFRYRHTLFNFEVFGPFGDGTYMMGPLFGYIDKVKDSGDIPLWIDGMLYGFPLYSSPMISLDYPFFFFNFIDYSGLQGLRNITLLVCFHLLFYVYGNYFLLKLLRVSNSSALIGAMCALLPLSITKFTLWGLNLIALSWFPIVLIGIVLIFDYKKFVIGILILVLSSFGVTAKPSQPFIQIVIVTLPILLYGLIKHKFNRKILVALAIAGVSSIGMAAKSFLPALMEIGDKLRWVARGKTVVGSEPIEFKFYQPYFGFDKFYELFITNNDINTGPGHIYMGTIAVFLIVGGSAYIISKKEKISWLFYPTLILAIYFLFSCFEYPINLTKINYHIPFLNKIRQPVRHSLVVSICLPLLVGICYHVLETKKRFLYAIIVLIVAVLATQIHWNNYDYIFVIWFLTANIVLSIVYFRLKGQYSFLLIIWFILLVFTNSFLVKSSQKVHPRVYRFNNKPNIESHDLLDKLKNEINPSFDRIVFHDKFPDHKWAMNSLYYGLRTFYSKFAPIPQDLFSQYRNRDSRPNYRRLIGGKYNLRNAHSDKISSNSEDIVLKTPKHIVYRDTMASEWAYFPKHIIYYKSTKDFYKKVRKKYTKNTIFLHESLGQTQKKEIQSRLKAKNDEISYERLSHNEFSISINTSEPSLVVINEHYSKNWKLYLNDISTDLMKVNLGQIGVFVPAGKSNIVLQYEPSIIKWLNYVQVLTGILMMMGLVFYLRWTKRAELEKETKNNLI